MSHGYCGQKDFFKDLIYELSEKVDSAKVFLEYQALAGSMDPANYGVVARFIEFLNH